LIMAIILYINEKLIIYFHTKILHLSQLGLLWSSGEGFG
jgi:hypothetical protein